MSKKLKVLALVLVAILTLSVFAGCKNNETQGSSSVLTSSETESDGNQTEGKPNEGEGTGDTSDVASGEGEEPADGDGNEVEDTSSTTSMGGPSGRPDKQVDVNKTGLKIVNNKITFEILAKLLPSRGDPEKMSMFKWIEENLNIKTKIIAVTEGKLNERKTLMIQSGDMPDLFNAGFSDTELAKYTAGKKPALIDALPYIEKGYAPTISEILKDPTVRRLNINEDGKLFSVPNKPANNEEYNHWLNINKTWLVNLGIVDDDATAWDIYKEIDTPEKFFDVLEAFRDDDPDGDGVDDQWPMALWQTASSFFISFFGVDPANGSVGIDLDYKVYYPYSTKSARQACLFWNRVYTADRMLDKSIPNQSAGNYAAFSTHIKDKEVGFFNWSYLTDAQFPSEKLKDYVAIPKPGVANESGLNISKSVNPFSNGISRGQWFISSDCSNVYAMVRYLDFLASDDGVMVGNYGAVGQNFTINKDGTYTVKIPGDADYQNAMGWAMGINEVKDQVRAKVKKINPNVGNQVYGEYKNAANKTYAEAHVKFPQLKLPNVQLTAKEIASLNQFSKAGFDNSANYLTQIVIGSKSINEFDTQNDNWNKAGLQKYLSVYQGIVDRNKDAMFTTGDWCKKNSAYI
ncbi:MAG: hypothetical protein UHH95_02625 [Oscillospiraceae bacterium]|nr:hypothetical protein [Oscillospiraceae bacterium]